MKLFLLGFLLAAALFTALLLCLHRFGRNPRHAATAPDPLYLEWLEKTLHTAANPPPGGDLETRWIQRVRDAFHPFTEENTSSHFPLAYAETFYFRDAFHGFTDREALVAYMAKTARNSPGVLFEFGPVARQGPEMYLPWTMVLPARDGAPPQRSLGLSHLRFNHDGLVVFHQDYWDSADVLVPRVPVANGLVEAVRRRF